MVWVPYPNTDISTENSKSMCVQSLHFLYVRKLNDSNIYINGEYVVLIHYDYNFHVL